MTLFTPHWSAPIRVYAVSLASFTFAVSVKLFDKLAFHSLTRCVSSSEVCKGALLRVFCHTCCLVLYLIIVVALTSSVALSGAADAATQCDICVLHQILDGPLNRWC